MKSTAYNINLKRHHMYDSNVAGHTWLCTTMETGCPASRVIPTITALFCVHAAAVRVYFINQCLDGIGRREARDTMAEIEYVTAVADRAEIVYHLADLGADRSVWPKQHHRVEVALQCHTITDLFADLPEAGRPV